MEIENQYSPKIKNKRLVKQGKRFVQDAAGLLSDAYVLDVEVPF